MHLDKYPVLKGPGQFNYHFFSEGPKGKIEKVIEFFEIYPSVYNLAFGDLDKETGRIKDEVTSNNLDRDKILATVAASVADFVKGHHEAVIYAEGSTKSRTRLYQMGISKYWDEISQEFEVYGLCENKWRPFAKGENYDSFFLRARK